MFLVAQSAWWNACMVHCYVCDLRVTMPLFLGLWTLWEVAYLCRSCFCTEDLCSPEQLINDDISVCFGKLSRGQCNHRSRVTTIYGGLSISRPTLSKAFLFKGRLRRNETLIWPGTAGRLRLFQPWKLQKNSMSKIHQGPSFRKMILFHATTCSILELNP